jgi:hypothetical protein
MRRIEDKICSLCTQILATKGGDGLRPILAELRDALHLHIERLRGRLLEYPIVLERRKQNGIPLPGYATPENAIESTSATTGKP